jgi:arylsulfatase A-like enzyme
VYDGLVSNLDVAPTLLEMAGCDVPQGLAGRSFGGLLDGGGYAARDEVCGALFYDVAYDPMHYVRTTTHKYIRSFAVTDSDAAGADGEVLSTFAAGQWIRVDDFDVLSSAAWRSMSVDTSCPPREELYDLVADPCEQHNLADDAAAAGVLAEMRGRLEAMMRRTESPLVDGHVAPPEAQREATRRFRPGGPAYDRLHGH